MSLFTMEHSKAAYRADFVMHGLQPFSRWHAEHHQRPTALICTPTILSATLVFFPALVLLGNLWRACALTLGVLIGYLSFSITHHAIYHWCADIAWLKQRKQWHALHHHTIGQSGCFGMTSAFWDHVFGSARRQHSPRTWPALR
ncbi:MAG: sterol desaturase family protein [Gammaproteobacteria bacterium]|nr:sterol desaturase family protein [Gammaproteobacteria bacterium]